MESSIQEHLIESGEDDNVYYLPDDDDDDDDDDRYNFIYALNRILSGTARLNVLLPTATILSFAIFSPLLTDDGKCETLNRVLTGIFLVLLAASCVLFSITDSFRTATGRLYYGVATFGGIWTFGRGKRKPCVPSDYRLRWADLFHVLLSLIAFLTFAASHSDVLNCYYPKMPRKVVNSFPLVVGFVISVLFVMFPSRRRGIGYPFLLLTDAFYFRN